MYEGRQYRLYLNGGWNASDNHDLIPKEFVTDINNINLHNGGKQPRGGCEVVNDTAITGSPQITGLLQFVRESGTLNGHYVVDEFGDNIGDENGNLLVSEGANELAGTSAGEIILDYSTVLKTGLTINTYFNFVVFYDEVFITNGVDKPQVFGGGLTYTWDMGSPIACTATAVAGAGVTAGTHSYKITFTTASGESSGGVKSNVVTTSGGNLQVDLTNIEIGPAGTTKRTIYRTIAGDTGNHLFVVEIADNTTITYSDNKADGDLGAASPTDSLAFLPSDWQGSWPKHMIKHGKSGNNCLVAWGVEAYPNRLYFSENGLADFSNGNVVAMNILTDKIVAVAEFVGQLIVFSQDKAFIVNDTDTDIANWTYSTASWDGGCAHQNLLVRLPNDLAVMSEEGNIYSVKATFQHGDYEIGSITKPVFLDDWIRKNIDLSQIEKFHGIYDDELRAVKYFMIPNGESLPSLCLVYFVDFNLWSKHTFDIKHLCSNFLKINNSVWKIFTGGDVGIAHSLESKIFLDSGSTYRSNFKTTPFTMDNPRTHKIFDNLWTVVKPKGQEVVQFKIYIDNDLYKTILLRFTGAEDISRNIVNAIGTTGNRIEIEFENLNGDDYFISQFIFDYQDIGSAIDVFYDVIYPEKGYLFAGNSGVTSHMTEEYSIDFWTSKSNLPSPIRELLAASTILNKGYVYGGFSGNTALQDTDEYDPDTWAVRTDMPSPIRAGLSASTILNKGYVFGGFQGPHLQDTDEYDPDTWASKTDMPTPARNYLTSSTILNKGYVFGGSSSGTLFLQDTDEYNPDLWTSKSDMPSPARSGSSSVTLYDKGYVFGGIKSGGDIQDTDEYNNTIDIWTSKTDMPLPARSFLSSTTILELGFIFGGLESSILQDTDEYNDDVWTSKADANTLTNNAAASSIF
jgi:hypothetical protein